MHAILSTTFIVGHKPFPLSYAVTAEFKASKASFSPKVGMVPSSVGLYVDVEEMEEYTLDVSPVHVINSPLTKYVF